MLDETTTTELLQQVADAFGRRVGARRLQIYWQAMALKVESDRVFEKACMSIIQNGDGFPTIRQLLDECHTIAAGGESAGTAYMRGTSMRFYDYAKEPCELAEVMGTNFKDAAEREVYERAVSLTPRLPDEDYRHYIVRIAKRAQEELRA